MKTFDRFVTLLPSPVSFKMGDRVSEVQLLVNDLGKSCFTALGVVQRDAMPAVTEAALRTHTSREDALSSAMQLSGVSSSLPVSTISSLAADVVAMSRVIDQHIEELPGAHVTESEQLATLARLDEENRRLGDEIVRTVKLAESMHEEVCAALERLSLDRLADQLERRTENSS